MRYRPAVPASSLQMVVEPSQEDLVRSQLEKVLDSLALFTQPIELRVELDIDLSKQTSSNNLPDETENEMLATFCDVRCTDVHDGAANTLCRGNDNVVVLRDLESVQRLLGGRLVENTSIDRVWDRVVDQFAQNQTVLAFVEYLHCVGGDCEAASDIRVVLDDL